ncbi:MAG: hypothetical protein NZ528_08390 [Caldilineales bacterium]|nr:hypothetical protein [Caldilineales bacterium]MDW8317595.1 hypothetical protein [Anaerolineae bacterium]
MQEFEIDNCNGKADAKRVQERAVFIKSDVSAEIAVQLGLTVPAASAAVETAVELALGDIREHRTAMELAAPPGTRMAFELVWLENRRAGVVQIRGLNIPFEVLEPVDVRIKSQYDVGCPELTPSPINSQPASQDTMSGSLVLCGEPAFNGNLLTSEPLFLRPERYLSGWISSDPSMIVLPNGTSRVFDTQYVLIVEDLPSIQIKGVQTREGKANTWGCWYSADLASVVEEEAKKDFCVKKAGGNVAVLYRVSHTGFEQIATTATISCP